MVSPMVTLVNSHNFIFFLAQSEEDGRGNGQTVKLSKLNGLKKTEQEEDVREMITPSLREALTKQGWKKKWYKQIWIFNLIIDFLSSVFRISWDQLQCKTL